MRDGVAQMLAVKRHAGNATAEMDSATEQFAVFTGIYGLRMGNFQPVSLDTAMDKVPGPAQGGGQGAVHVLATVMIRTIRLPGQDGLVRGLLKTQGD